MAPVITPQASPLANRVIKDVDVNATPVVDITGGAPGTIYNLDIDNIANPAEVVYFKIYDNGSPTIGTDPPDWVFRVPGGQRRSFVIPEGTDFATALTYCCVTQGGSVGNTSPGNPVSVLIVTS